MFEHAMQFLSNPKKLWGSKRLEDKKTVLKLAFQERLPYHRETGFRTPKTTIPISTLAGISMDKSKMAHLSRETSNTLFEALSDWNTQLKHIDYEADNQLLNNSKQRLRRPSP